MSTLVPFSPEWYELVDEARDLEFQIEILEKNFLRGERTPSQKRVDDIAVETAWSRWSEIANIIGWDF